MIVNGQERLDLSEVVVPAGIYYLGDPCYVLDDDEWDVFCGTGLRAADKPGSRYVVALPTRYGDGMYQCEHHGKTVTELAVDSGMIGLASIMAHGKKSPDIVDKDDFWFSSVTARAIHYPEFVHIVGFDKPVTVRDDDGVLVFGDYRVDTRRED